ncbi:death on curing protein [Glycocaulis alkaliphilus]|uniref:Death on curing protein n=1 Tax=Glycocaulis alkaliphilus TaxID=1434191 RepID=A0A3T0E6X5_9PROT|nr:type II toxin-antitoxin system death-on-curing family toxin [Glycocaulis alkaliphilus]AZU03151.1 death on curing protein [Glycocaulis alkaliphilus]GGB71380.1 death-on-curing protein [Glycocaulis alkaliphilus]
MSHDIRLLPLSAILDAYEREMDATGGARGLRDEGALNSAISRAENKLAYADPAPQIHDLAASIGFGIAKNHPFLDGNKRMAFIASYMMLRINGWYLDATERDATRTMLALADGSLDEAGFAAWLTQWSYKL